MKTMLDLSAVNEILEKNCYKQQAIISILQEIQEVYHYLPREVFPVLSQKLKMSEARIYSIATFYENFSLEPKGKYIIGCCLGTACYVKGSGAIYDKFQEILGIGGDECTADRKFSLTASRCIGACGLAPVLTVNEDVYGRLTTADVEGIVAKYK